MTKPLSFNSEDQEKNFLRLLMHNNCLSFLCVGWGRGDHHAANSCNSGMVFMDSAGSDGASADISDMVSWWVPGIVGDTRTGA